MAKSKQGNSDWCAFDSCRQKSDIIWLSIGLCNKHFAWKCDNGLEKAYKKFQVSEEKKKINSEKCECHKHKNLKEEK